MPREKVRRVVHAAAADAEPYLIWNAFVDLLAMENYKDLTPLQRKAHLIFWYESEVQNGGHGQYFENRGMDRLAETCEALTEFGLPDHSAVLSQAIAAMAARPPGTPWEILFQAGEPEEFDDAFNKCRPTIMEALERHLADHSAEYVEQS